MPYWIIQNYIYKTLYKTFTKRKELTFNSFIFESIFVCKSASSFSRLLFLKWLKVEIQITSIQTKHTQNNYLAHCKRSLANKVPRVLKCPSAWIHKCPSSTRCLEYPSVQVPFEFPSALSTRVFKYLSIPKCLEYPSIQIPFEFPGALSTRVFKYLSSSQVPWVPECSSTFRIPKCLEYPSVQVPFEFPSVLSAQVPLEFPSSAQSALWMLFEQERSAALLEMYSLIVSRVFKNFSEYIFYITLIIFWFLNFTKIR